MKKGLYGKYIVIKVGSGEVLENCFVLRPDKDLHALEAILAYAESCEDSNPDLAADLRAMANEIIAKTLSDNS